MADGRVRAGHGQPQKASHSAHRQEWPHHAPRGATPRHHGHSPATFNAMLPLHVEMVAKHELLHYTVELDQEGHPGGRARPSTSPR